MKKKMIPLVLVLALLLSLGAHAAEPRVSLVATPKLSFTGTTANCSVVISSPGDEIEATLTLWRGSTIVKSWPASAQSLLLISESWPVTKGVTYTLTITGTIGGQSINGTAVSGTC